ncbi:MAG: hypothetical protein JRH04_01435 [Deltaproteobacteria bacterium]|nr:hypothetical protein [Deltaproteobacteria bacterium]
MNSYEEDLQYERKMDRISEQIEELMLDAILTALKKIKERNLFYSSVESRPQNDPYPF